MLYKVQGARKDTGANVIVTIEASSEASALTKANRQGILVERCKQVSMAQAVPTMDDAVVRPMFTRNGLTAADRSAQAAAATSPAATATPTKPVIMPPPIVVSQQLREVAWVLQGFGWLFFVCCAGSAIVALMSAADGELAVLNSDGRITWIVLTMAANALAIGLIFASPNRLAAMTGSMAANAATSPSGPLSSRFKMLGDVRGRTLRDIVAATGRPRSTSSMGGGMLVQWLEGGYHISLLFDGSGDEATCRGIRSETSV